MSSSSKIGRPFAVGQRISILKRHNAAMETVYYTQVREADGRRIYIGIYRDQEAARNDAQAYVTTGQPLVIAG